MCSVYYFFESVGATGSCAEAAGASAAAGDAVGAAEGEGEASGAGVKVMAVGSSPVMNFSSSSCTHSARYTF